MMKLLVVGDFCGSGRLSRLESASEVLGNFVDLIRGSDLSIVNLEAPICESLHPINKTGPSIAHNRRSAAFLSDAGFNLATLANNHIFDYGEEGLQSTISVLDDWDIDIVGAGLSFDEASRPFRVTKGNQTVVVLNFTENEWSTTAGSNPGASPIDPVRNFNSIREAQQSADFVVVVCHGGHELYDLPSPRMKELFRFYVDAGANAVVNHHPHYVSGYELYQGAPIFYSLGNFLFDNPKSRSGPWTQGIAVEMDFSNGKLNHFVRHFDQCTERDIFRLCNQDSIESRQQMLSDLNDVINDDDKLYQSFLELSEREEQRYLAYLEPIRSRFLVAAQNRGFAPSLLSQRQRTLLLNLFRCEAHRDLVIEVLERDVGNSR